MCIGSRSNIRRTTAGETKLPKSVEKRFSSTSERRLYYIDHVPKVPPSSPTNWEAAPYTDSVIRTE